MRNSCLGPEKNNYSLGISGQVPKDRYNEHAPSNVKAGLPRYLALVISRYTNVHRMTEEWMEID